MLLPSVPTPAQSNRRQSFWGGVDGRGKPMFANLKASKRKHMCDGYEDMKPKEGIVGSVYRWLVDGRHPAQH